MEEGVTGVDFGEVSQARSDETLTFYHGLGTVPSVVCVAPKGYPTTTNYIDAIGFITGRGLLTELGSGGYQYSDNFDISSTDRQVTIRGTDAPFDPAKWCKGTYYWFALA